MEQIIEFSRGANGVYFFFILVLIFINSLVKYILETKDTRKKQVLIVSIFTIIIFWYFNAGFYKLIFCMFFAFGFYDWLGQYIEQGIAFSLAFIKEQIKAGWQKLKTLYKK